MRASFATAILSLMILSCQSTAGFSPHVQAPIADDRGELVTSGEIPAEVDSGVKSNFEIPALVGIEVSPDLRHYALKMTYTREVLFNQPGVRASTNAENLPDSMQIFDVQTKQFQSVPQGVENSMIWQNNQTLLFGTDVQGANWKAFDLITQKTSNLAQSLDSEAYSIQRVGDLLYTIDRQHQIKQLDLKTLTTQDLYRLPQGFYFSGAEFVMAPDQQTALVIVDKGTEKQNRFPEGGYKVAQNTEPLSRPTHGPWITDAYIVNADKTSVRLQSGSSYLSAISFGNLEDLFSPAGGQHILMREAQAKQTEVFDTITGKQVLAVDGDAIGWLDQDHFAVNNAGELLIYRLTQTAPVIRLATSIRSDAYEFYWDAIHQQLLNLDGNTIQAYHLTTEGIKSHTVFSGSADSTLSLRRGNATQVMLEQSFKDQAQALSLHAYMPEQLRFEKQFEVPRRPGSVKFDRNDSRWIYFRK